MAEKLIGIVGCGAIARHHLLGYQQAGGKIAAVADTDLAAAEVFSHDLLDVEVVESYQELIDSGRVDAISICTPPAFHEEVAIYALERDIHVLCEKPLAHTLESAQRIASAAQASDALLMCAFRHRFMPAIRKLKELSSEIGPLVYCNNMFCGPLFQVTESWFSKRALSGGGVLIDTATHSIDLFRYLVGEIANQEVMTHQNLPGIEVEDSAILSLKGISGVLGSIIATWVSGTGVASIDLVGQKGRLFYDYSRGTEIKMILSGETDWQTFEVEQSGGFREEITHFIGAIEEKWPLSCTADDAVRVMEVLDAVYKK